MKNVKKISAYLISLLFIFTLLPIIVFASSPVGPNDFGVKVGVAFPKRHDTGYSDHQFDGNEANEVLTLSGDLPPGIYFEDKWDNEMTYVFQGAALPGHVGQEYTVTASYSTGELNCTLTVIKGPQTSLLAT